MTHGLPLRVIWYHLTWRKWYFSLGKASMKQFGLGFFLRCSHKRHNLTVYFCVRLSKEELESGIIGNIWCPSVLMELSALRWICFLIKCSLHVSKWGILCLWKRINCYLPLGIVYPRPPWGQRIGHWRTPSLPIVSMQRKGKVLVAFDNQFQHSAGLAISHAS